MYTIFILLAVASVCFCRPEDAKLTPEQTTKLLQNSMQCIGETGVSPDAILQVKSGKFSNDEKFQKFLFCTLNKSGVVGKSGKIKINKAIEKYPNNVDKEAIKKVMVECNEQSGATPVETTAKVFGCFHKKTPVHLKF